MTKFCPNCGKKLDNNATMCLNCGVIVDNKEINNFNKSKEKKKGFPTWAIILIVVGCTIILPILLIAITVVITFNTISNIDVENIIEDMFTTQNGVVGDTLISEDFQITLTEALTYDYLGTEEDKEVPEEGKEFLVLFFDIKNMSDETKNISTYDFEGYADDYSLKNKHLSNNINNMEELGVNLAPGKKTRGYIVYEIEKEWQEFTIHYKDIFVENEIVFTIINDNNLNNNNITGA